MKKLFKKGTQKRDPTENLVDMHSYYQDSQKFNLPYSEDDIDNTDTNNTETESEFTTTAANTNTASKSQSHVERIVVQLEDTLINTNANTNTNTNLTNSNANNNVLKTTSPVINCCLCKTTKTDNFTILSCNHVFHVRCLAELHFGESGIINSEFLMSRRCSVCRKQLQSEELLFLHTKFLNNTKERIDTHNKSIAHLEEKFRQIKEELKACYDVKQQLESQKDKSKQIVTSLMTLI